MSVRQKRILHWCVWGIALLVTAVLGLDKALPFPLLGQWRGTDVGFDDRNHEHNSKELILRANHGTVTCWMRLKISDEQGNRVEIKHLVGALRHSANQDFKMQKDADDSTWVMLTGKNDDFFKWHTGKAISIECSAKNVKRIELANWEVHLEKEGKPKDSASCKQFRNWSFWPSIFALFVSASYSLFGFPKWGIVSKSDIEEVIENKVTGDTKQETTVMRDLLRCWIMKKEQDPQKSITWPDEYDTPQKKNGKWAKARHEFTNQLRKLVLSRM